MRLNSRRWTKSSTAFLRFAPFGQRQEERKPDRKTETGGAGTPTEVPNPLDSGPVALRTGYHHPVVDRSGPRMG